MQKVWNVSDGPRSKAEPAILMLFGRSVRPGRFVAVSEDRLARAHKLEQDKKAGMVYVGPSLPSWYKEAKTPVHARFPIGHKRAHGPELKEGPYKTVKVVAKPVDVPTWEAGVSGLPTYEEPSKDSKASDESEEQSDGRKKRRRS